MLRNGVRFFARAGFGYLCLIASPSVCADPSPAEPDDEQMEEINVTGEQVDIDPTVIDPQTEKLFNTAGTAGDPLAGVLSLPGVTTGGSGRAPAVRGSAPGDNTYLVDMIPARYIFHVFGDSIFNENLIHRFDLHSGAYGSEYSNAIGAVMDVTLREPAHKAFTTTADWSFLRTGLFVESGIGDDQAFYASYRRSLIDQFYPEDENEELEEEEGIRIDSLPVSHDYQAKYSWRPAPGHRLNLIAAGAGDDIEATFRNNSNLALRDPDFLGAASIREGFDSGGLQYNWHRPDSGPELDAALNFSQEYTRLDYGTGQYQHVDASRSIFHTRYSTPVAGAHDLQVGATVADTDYRLNLEAKIRPCDFFVPECTTLDATRVTLVDELAIQTRELYVEDRWRLGEPLEWTYGLHYGENDYLDESLLEPRTRLAYFPAEDWQLTAAAGRYHQLPELFEIAPAVGNPDLKHPKADHYVLGVERQGEAGWSWKSEVYYKEMTDLVLSLSADRDPDYEQNYSNDATGQAYGVELFVNKDLTDNWYGWVSLSLSETRRRNERTGAERDFDYSRPVIFNIVGNYQIDDRWLFGFKWTVQSGLLYTPIVDVRANEDNPDVQEPVYGQLNSQRLPTYHRLDIRAERRYRYAWGQWSWYVDLINAYNQRNVEGYSYAPNRNDVEGSPPDGFGEDVPVRANEGLGIFPSIGLKITF